MAEKTLGTAWCEGGDPEDGGWHFDGGDTVDGYTMAYETGSRDEALEAGIPAEVLDMFETSGGAYGEPGRDLFTWLQEHSDLFRT